MKPSIQSITIKAAKGSKFPRFRHACTIESGGKVLAAGVNTVKPRTPNSSFSTHAEIQSLKRLMTILIRQGKRGTFELYVARVDTSDQIAFSKPCPKCLEAIKNSGVIGLVHYTTGQNGWESVRI